MKRYYLIYRYGKNREDIMKTFPLSLLAGFLVSPFVLAAPDLIFTHGDVITVTGESDRAEAIAIKDGIIVAVGNNQEILKQKGTNTQVRDLKGKTVAPGFIDSHGHFAQ